MLWLPSSRLVNSLEMGYMIMVQPSYKVIKKVFLSTIHSKQIILQGSWQKLVLGMATLSSLPLLSGTSKETILSVSIELCTHQLTTGMRVYLSLS